MSLRIKLLFPLAVAGVLAATYAYLSWPSEPAAAMFSLVLFGSFAVCMDGSAMRQNLPHLAIFKIFSVRAAAEIERALLRGELEHSETRSA